MTTTINSENVYEVDRNEDRVAVYFNNEAARNSFIAQFPKSYNVRPGSCGYYNYATGQTTNRPTAFMFFNNAKKVTGDKNEQGNKRLARFETELAKIIELTRSPPGLLNFLI